MVTHLKTLIIYTVYISLTKDFATLCIKAGINVMSIVWKPFKCLNVYNNL